MEEEIIKLFETINKKMDILNGNFNELQRKVNALSKKERDEMYSKFEIKNLGQFSILGKKRKTADIFVKKKSEDALKKDECYAKKMK